MEEYRKDIINYDEDWRCFDTPRDTVTLVDKEESVNPPIPRSEKSRKERSFPSLLTIQLILGLLIVFSVFMLKAMDSDIYHRFSAWYRECMNKVLVDNSTFEDIDLSSYLKATIDEN